MTESECWLEIAESWSMPRRSVYDGEADWWMSSDEALGLCGSIGIVNKHDHVGGKVVTCMRSRLKLFEPWPWLWAGFFWGHSRADAEQRMWAALFLAAMTEEGCEDD